MPANQEYVHLAWPLCLINLRVASNAINARRLPLALLVWSDLRQLQIVPSAEDKENYLENPMPAAPVAAPGQQVPPHALAAHAELKTMFAQQAKHELLQTVREFHTCKQREGQSNYNIHNMGKTVNELHAMLKLQEQTMPKKDDAPALHAIRAGRVQKNQKKKPHKAAKGNQGKGNAKMGYAPVPAPSFAPKPKNPPPLKKDNHAKDTIRHQCGKVGYWRRNYPIYLAELLKKKKLYQGDSTSSIFTIELYYFPCTSWVYDTGCGTHICITTQGLRGSRNLKPGALSLYVGDGQRAKVKAIRELHLCLPISRNNLVYFTAIPMDSIYEIDLSSFNTNDSSIKMAKKPYSHQVERAKYLLGLLHTDVCGPFRTMSRQGASYFVTFTDDFSRYGYVYLLKHKHKVFETLKVFQKEVENQLGKTIKSLHSNCRGEYMSQEFLDHLKEHVIIAHRTPPYTPQHNGVSERRNIILLDIVRSMMSQTTLPKFFWDYALESDACILNMVLTKKVKKTPYEVWHGQAPKLSYLKVWGCETLVKCDTLTKPDKLEPKSIKCFFVGYPKETIGYSFYYPPENKIFIAQNVEFFENSLITQEASGSIEDFEIIQEEDTHPSIDTSLHHDEDGQEIDEPQSDINPIHKSTRIRRAPDRTCLHVEDEEHELEGSCKWLFNKKTDVDGVVHTYKACLVAKDFTQTYGVDYEETFSPVIDIRAIRILIAIAAFYDYEIWQIDVKTGFPNGHLSKEVYMVQPE
nr:hypothetical protein [Tanacetum cinerariifolium]